MIQIQKEKAPPVATDAIEHLVACHRRIEQRLDILERAGSLLPEKPEQCLLAIANSLRFMDTSGMLHTVDEEESVFPRLRQAATPDELAYLDNLEKEHNEADAVYAQLKVVVAKLTQHAIPELIAEYRELVSRLAQLYRGHIASEDIVLVEMGHRALTEDQLATIQAEMRARRQ
jgi:hemerythrin-like domain-containing protein